MPFPIIRPLAFLFTLFAVHSLGAAQSTPQLKWELSGFNAPESVAYDAQRDCFYVSNLATRGKDRTPDDGFI
ncbi:hypothetical protein N9K67_08165, partial [Opitutaceae bacterium]|nr:hypothetical protein [Opitutaceae bacterium]